MFAHIPTDARYDWVVDMGEYEHRKAQMRQLRESYDVLMSRYPQQPADADCRQFAVLL